MGIGHGAVRHMTQWALLVWSVTQVWVPGHTTLEQDSGNKKNLFYEVYQHKRHPMVKARNPTNSLLHSPWYIISRSGCPLQRTISRAHSSLYVLPSLPQTACFLDRLEQSGEQMHWGRPPFILQIFPGPHFTPSHVSTTNIKSILELSWFWFFICCFRKFYNSFCIES